MRTGKKRKITNNHFPQPPTSLNFNKKSHAPAAKKGNNKKIIKRCKGVNINLTPYNSFLLC